MTTLNLDKFLSGHVFAFMFIFSRVGAVMVLMPGIGEAYVSPRIRLLFALMLSFLLMGPLLPRVPAPPDGVPDFLALIGYEAIVGLFFGTLMRLLVSTLEAAGSIVAIQTGLSNATILNPALAVQSPLASAFLSVAGVTLIFVTGLDHLIFRTIVSLYDVFPPAGQLMTGDMAQAVIQGVNKSFVIGIELAMPFLIIGLLMYVALGIMQKLLPQVQLFLIAMPIQIWGGLALLSITVAGIMTLWLRYFDAALGQFIAP